MFRISLSIFSLLFSTGILLLGISLQSTLLGLRAGLENYSMTMTGIVMSSYFVGFALGSYYNPNIIRLFGHIRTYAALATLASAAAIAHALYTEPWFWTLLRIITGFCVVGMYMIIESWLNSLASNAMRGKFFGLYMIITLLAMAIGQHLLRLGEVISFELFAITTILISLALVPVVLTRLREPQISQPKQFGLLQLYAVSPLGVVGTLSAGLITGSFWGMGAVYAAQIGLDANGVAWLMSAIILGGALLQWPLGLLSDRIDRRTVIQICAFSGAALAILNSAISIESSLLFYTVSFLFGGYVFIFYGLCAAHVNDQIDADHSLEAAQGLLQLYGIGAIVGPLLTALSFNIFGSRGMLFLFALIMFGLGLFTLLRMQKASAPAPEEQTSFVPLARTSPVALEMSPINEVSQTDAAEEGSTDNKQ
jgi:MFS family permease